MITIFWIDSYLEDIHFNSSLVAKEVVGENAVELVLREGVENHDVLKIEIDLSDGSYRVLPSNTGVASTFCIAGCGVASFAGAIFECWRKTKNSKDKKEDFIHCLKGKGVSISSSYIQCVTGCLFGALSTS